MNRFAQELYAVGACEEAVAWVEVFDDPNEAWQQCTRSDWMRWLLIQGNYGAQGLADRESWPGTGCGCLPCCMKSWSADRIRKLIPDYPL